MSFNDTSCFMSTSPIYIWAKYSLPLTICGCYFLSAIFSLGNINNPVVKLFSGLVFPCGLELCFVQLHNVLLCNLWLCIVPLCNVLLCKVLLCNVLCNVVCCNVEYLLFVQ